MYFIIQHDTALTYRVLILKIIISGRAHSLGRNQGFRRHRFLSRPWWKTLPDKIQINVSQSPVHWNLGPMMAKVIRGNLWWWNFSPLKEMVGLHPLFILFCFLVWRWVPWSTIHSLTLPSDSPSKVMKEMHRPGHGPESLKWLNNTFIYFLTALSRVFFCSDGKVASTLAPSSFRLLSWSYSLRWCIWRSLALFHAILCVFHLTTPPRSKTAMMYEPFLVLQLLWLLLPPGRIFLPLSILYDICLTMANHALHCSAW